MATNRRIRNVVIGVAAAGVTAAILAVTLPASAALFVSDYGYGQVTVNLHTVPHSLNSLQAEGNPCEPLDWKYLTDSDFIAFLGPDEQQLLTTSGARLTFYGYSSADCSGSPADTVIRTFGAPDQEWATGSLYEIPWESN